LSILEELAANLSISNFKMKKNQNIVITVILAAILVGALSFVMPKNKEKYFGDRFWTQKTFAPAVYDIVIIGDSRTYRGVSPEIMEEKLPGTKILNFGYSNGGLNPTMFEVAEKKLSDKNSKKGIVLGVSANCITDYTQKNEQFWQEKKRHPEDIFERLYSNGILYHFSATSPEGLQEYFKKKTTTSYYRNEYHSSGYVESEKFPVDTMEAIPSYTDDFTHFKVDEQLINDLIKQVKDWTAKGITVVGFRPPTTVPMRALEDTMGLYNEAVISTRFKEAGGYWVNLNNSLYKTYDGSHLDKKSAIRLSEDLANEISGILKVRKK
jgi:hypothetical protein